MAGRVYVTDQDAEEPEDFIVGLTTQVYVLSCLYSSIVSKGAFTELKLSKDYWTAVAEIPQHYLEVVCPVLDFLRLLVD